LFARESMAAFLYGELDFIFFFYGLAFILLGTVCFAIARVPGRGGLWGTLGLFAYCHGLSEWLDLSALIIGDTPWFAAARTAVTTASFIFLLEFARLEAGRLGLRTPGRWIYGPLIALVAGGGLLGGDLANALARYAIGFSSAMATALVFFLEKPQAHARHKRQWAFSIAASFALYGLAAGVIVPAAPFWPADVLNNDSFVHLTGVPIQFVRGLLACWMTFSIWGYWRQKLILDISSPRYTQYLQKQFIWTLVAMAVILVFGWTLTEYLGGIYKQTVQDEARGDLDLIASHLAGETTMVEGMVKSLAGSPSVTDFLAGNHDKRHAQIVLDLDVQASGAEFGYLFDRMGAIVASSDGRKSKSPVAENDPPPANIADAVPGAASYRFEFDAAENDGQYSANYPVFAAGKLVGTAVITRSLTSFEADLRQFDHPFFLIDPHGIVILTNRPKMLFQALWPLSAETRQALSRQFGPLGGKPILDSEIADATWVKIEGQRGYLRRRFANHSDWSLVTVTLPHKIFANRVLGIVITLMMTIVTLVYLVGRERWVRDNVHLSKRLELEELARKLDFRATTDPLTGLFNRRKFNHELSLGISRAQRYGTPLSLVIFDVDHFKAINDTYGHQVGDKVLIDLSKLIAARLRKTDVFARWGGEEFIILVPEASASMALQLAENLRDSIRQSVSGDAETVTCSFGIAEFKDGDSADTFISRADEALYRAKINGRNRVESASAFATPEQDIRDAMNQ
jgi:diguanylate cyclase (GGDEF)-like protein